MKKFAVYFNLIFFGFLLQNCREEEHVSPGKVQFTFHASDLDNGGGRTQFDLAVLSISISQSNGDPVHTLKELTLTKFGDEFISEPLALHPGNYTITDFLVADNFSTVLYAAPKEGSPLASFVEHPLPIPFNIDAEDEMTHLAVEVVATNAYLPEDFGYVTFLIDIVPVEVFKLSAFILAESGTTLELTGVQSYILLDGDTIYKKYLGPTANSILLPETTDGSYTLVLIKPAYKKYSKTFTLAELYQEVIGDSPWSIILTPALTFTTIPDATADPNVFEFTKNFDLEAVNASTVGTLNVDWGDGSTGTFQIPSNNSWPPAHIYPTAGPYFVSVSGDLQAIGGLSLFYGNAITDISIEHLSELKYFGMGASLTPSTLDLSHNKKLETINFSMGTFTELDVSNNTALKSVDLSFNSGFSAESLNALIHDVLQHAIDQNIHEGGINIMADYDETLVGPPSEAAKEDLRTLRDDYGWYIYPEEF